MSNTIILKLAPILISILFLNSGMTVSAQSDVELKRFYLQDNSKQKKYRFFSINSDNEIKFILYNAFVGYKKFISSQDVPACRFHPSCSEFGQEAIQEFGLIKGVLLGVDRLSRCHPFNTKKYPYDLVQKRLSDPVTDY